MTNVLENVFAKASRAKITYLTKFGVLSVSDLWDLSLEELDKIAVDLSKQVKDTEISFIGTKSNKDTKLNLALEVIKSIIEVKLFEREQAYLARDKAERKKKLLEILANKQDESLQAMSQEDLLKELEALG